MSRRTGFSSSGPHIWDDVVRKRDDLVRFANVVLPACSFVEFSDAAFPFHYSTSRLVLLRAYDKRLRNCF